MLIRWGRATAYFFLISNSKIDLIKTQLQYNSMNNSLFHMIFHQFTLKHYAAFALLLIAIVLASIHPLEFESYLLHQVGTLLMLIALVFVQKKYGLSFLSFCSYLLFLLIHVIAAHYLYSYVPYDEWLKVYLGFELNTYMGWSRNMYDRLVHFCYGLLLFPFFLRLFELLFPDTTPNKRLFLVVQFIMASSLFYEWIEWGLAIGLSPEEAEKYNGQQGDIWDAHQDMLLATIGAVIASAIHSFKAKIK